MEEHSLLALGGDLDQGDGVLAGKLLERDLGLYDPV